MSDNSFVAAVNSMSGDTLNGMDRKEVVDSLYKIFPIMNKLLDDCTCIVDIEKEQYLLHGCNEHYGTFLTKEDAQQISLFFSELSKHM